jgi:crotonobetainyl-CoA:carnitine CoA-transferase CaiB-like acyl-CoA transferase
MFTDESFEQAADVGVAASPPWKIWDSAAHHDGPAKRGAPERDPRLLRGRAQPRLDGHEWLGAPEPAWWLNLQTHQEAVVELAGGGRQEVLGRAATADERERLWQGWREIDKNLDDWAARRPRETAVVVLEPLAAAE